MEGLIVVVFLGFVAWGCYKFYLAMKKANPKKPQQKEEPKPKHGYWLSPKRLETSARYVLPNIVTKEQFFERLTESLKKVYPDCEVNPYKMRGSMESCNRGDQEYLAVGSDHFVCLIGAIPYGKGLHITNHLPVDGPKNFGLKDNLPSGKNVPIYNDMIPSVSWYDTKAAFYSSVNTCIQETQEAIIQETLEVEPVVESGELGPA